MIRVLLIFSMILNVVFIFYLSSFTQSVSAQQSTEAKDKVVGSAPVEPTEPTDSVTPAPEESEFKKNFKAFVRENIRDIAHFAEYGILAVQAITYIVIFMKARVVPTAVSILGGLTVAVIDEMVVQRISGRCPSIDDIMLDMSGFVIMVAVSYLLIFLFKLLNRLATGEK